MKKNGKSSILKKALYIIWDIVFTLFVSFLAWPLIIFLPLYLFCDGLTGATVFESENIWRPIVTGVLIIIGTVTYFIWITDLVDRSDSNIPFDV